MDEQDKDARLRIKLSQDYFDNPTIGSLSDTAQLLHRTARQLKDGETSVGAAKDRGEAAFKELVAGGLLIKVDARSYRIHDYAKHQTVSKIITEHKRAVAKPVAIASQNNRQFSWTRTHVPTH